MFTHLLPHNDTVLFRIDFSVFSKRNYLKYFEKKYPKKAWDYTVESIVQDLSRIRTSASDMQKSMQVDELWHGEDCWIFKYDFRVAGTKTSTKASGNRVVAFLDSSNNFIEILTIYDKGCLPKNKTETTSIEGIIKEEFPNYWKKTH
jgi:hypothetical protein